MKHVIREPIVVICEIDGSGMRYWSTEEKEAIIEELESVTFSQPWKQSAEK
jgi:hypothetical protein